MDYIDKLFKQHPFIYYIHGKYYAFGVNTCAECDKRSVLLEDRYREYEDGTKRNLEESTAWEIFHKLSVEATYFKETDESLRVKEKFAELNFSEEDKRELSNQVKRYVDYWGKYNLSQFYNER
jgi:hypothetical protein